MYGHLLCAIATAAFTIYIAHPQRKLWFQRNFRDGNRVRWTFLLSAIGICFLSLLRFLLQEHPVLDSILDALMYANLGFLIFLTARQRIRSVPAHSSLRILAIGAHPDDLEIACGGTLAKLTDAGHIIHAVVMCDGQFGGNGGIRPDEAKNGAQFMGVTNLEVHNFTDTELAKHEVELVRTIEHKINEFAPDVIFTHSKNDQHQDHQAVHFATLRAARRHPSVLCYESPSSTREFDPSFFVDLSDYVNVKVHAIEQHKDQLKKPYMGPDHIRGIAAFRGAQAKMRFAEGFEIVRLVDSSLEGI